MAIRDRNPMAIRETGIQWPLTILTLPHICGVPSHSLDLHWHLSWSFLCSMVYEERSLFVYVVDISGIVNDHFQFSFHKSIIYKNLQVQNCKNGISEKGDIESSIKCHILKIVICLQYC